DWHLEGSGVPEDTGSFQIMTGAGQDMRALLAALAAGAATAGAGLASDGVTGTVTADGILRVSGTASLVLGAGDATHLLLGAGTRSRLARFRLPGAPARGPPA